MSSGYRKTVVMPRCCICNRFVNKGDGPQEAYEGDWVANVGECREHGVVNIYWTEINSHANEDYADTMNDHVISRVDH